MTQDGDCGLVARHSDVVVVKLSTEQVDIRFDGKASRRAREPLGMSERFESKNEVKRTLWLGLSRKGGRHWVWIGKLFD